MKFLKLKTVSSMRASWMIKVKQKWVRFTIIPFVIVVVILFALLPVKFMLTGKWNYNWAWIQNWIRLLDI